MGKTTCAFEFASAVSQLHLKSWVHPDLIVIAPTSSSDADEAEEELNGYLRERKWRISESPNYTIRISQIRRVQQKLTFMPYSAKKRFVIAVDGHRMRTEAANAFLKTLEEPPVDTSVIMTVSHLSSLLPTVVSRGVLLRFKPLESGIVAEILRNKHGLDAKKAEKTAALCEGSLSKAIELAFDDEKNETRKAFITAFLSKDLSSIVSNWPARITERELVFTVIESLHSLCADFISASSGISKGLRNPDFADRIHEFIKGKDCRFFFRCEKACLEAERALNLNIDSGLIRDYLIEKTLK